MQTELSTFSLTVPKGTSEAVRLILPIFDQRGTSFPYHKQAVRERSEAPESNLENVKNDGRGSEVGSDDLSQPPSSRKTSEQGAAIASASVAASSGGSLHAAPPPFVMVREEVPMQSPGLQGVIGYFEVYVQTIPQTPPLDHQLIGLRPYDLCIYSTQDKKRAIWRYEPNTSSTPGSNWMLLEEGALYDVPGHEDVQRICRITSAGKPSYVKSTNVKSNNTRRPQ
ncbi:hypothetical protein EIP91_004909 [Steccherinum ochraceum]|uniref:Uncharacterized protein n=1 Tax=Steccherinum ochraceum TaxID=92696 RepID=A0A4R0RN93_9APHY|nr:hypothetical protein EIP91_004909 [Steccherinum ochraceum]